jgi:hypothetical protein
MNQKKQQTPVYKKKNKFYIHILEKFYFPIMEELSDIKGGTRTVGVCKQGTEENIWTEME